MDSSQKRRQELLYQTRKIYSDKYKVPAVHPRYGNFDLEKSGVSKIGDERKLSFFKLRILITLIIFVLYAGFEYMGVEIGKYNVQDVTDVISRNIDIQEVWNSW